MQVDGGLGVSCIQMEHSRALGLEKQMVLRDCSRQYRVRGIGQRSGTGQILTRDVWFSILVKERKVVDRKTDSMAPVGGSHDSLRVEGWFAVLHEMSVPTLVGGDPLHDVMPFMANRQIVIQKRGMYSP